MATEKISQRVPTNTMEGKDLRILLNSLQDDVAVLHAAISAIATKLNADAGVTDTNYAAPAALTFTK